MHVCVNDKLFTDEFHNNESCHGDKSGTSKHDVVIKRGVWAAPAELVQSEWGGKPG